MRMKRINLKKMNGQKITEQKLKELEDELKSLKKENEKSK